MSSTARFIRDAARSMRSDQTPHEHIMWNRLRTRRLGGYKFRRQHPIGRFIVDFACVEHKLVIEVDGDTHDPVVDAKRDRWLHSKGWRVLRYTNGEVDDGLDWILHHIHEVLAEIQSKRRR